MSKPYHQRPLYYGYNGGYGDITECKRCGRTSLYEDAHPVKCCFSCGGEVVEIGAGKWIKPVKSGIWPFRKIVSDVYWKRRGETNE